MVTVNSRLRLAILTPEPEQLIKKLVEADIQLYDVVILDFLTVHLTLGRREYIKVSNIAERHGASCKILHRQGFLWHIISLLKRPVLVFGFVLFLALLLLIPGRVLRVEVRGNSQIPMKKILQCAEEAGLRFGSKTRMIRSEQVKNKMLGGIPELQWVGINTKGCVVTIQVEERKIKSVEGKQQGIASIVAARDGIVSEVIVHDGTALCVPGQSVLQGEVLISGYSDQGLKVTATVADGEVSGFTRRELQAVSPYPTSLQSELEGKLTCYRLKIGKKVINFCNHSGISDATCDKMYSEYYWTLPGGFRLPVSVIKETCNMFDLQEIQEIQENDNVPSWLETNIEAYLTDQMIAGEILHRANYKEVAADHYSFEGIYFCREMIGKVRYEEIFGNYAENN